MSFISNTGADVLERQVGKCVFQCDSLSIDDQYDIEQCVSWITEGQYHKVCLQFPDELLGDAASVAETLTQLLNQQVYILGDTTYGSCCVDEVAAEHVGADAVIHFGNTCLSPSQRLPVLYITTRLPVSVGKVVERIKEGLDQSVIESCHPIVLLCDTRCQYAAGLILSKLHLCLPHVISSTLEGVKSVVKKDDDDDKVCYGSRVKDSSSCSGNISECVEQEDKVCCRPTVKDSSNNSEPMTNVHSSSDSVISVSNSDVETNLESSDGLKVKFNGRCVLLPKGTKIKDCTFIYLGPEGATLETFLLRFADSNFYHITPSGNDAMHKLLGTKSLFRRSAKLEMIRDASIIGILVGTLGVSKYRDAIARFKTIIKNAGKRSYTFVVGKPNEPKLANISEIDVFVYVACPETTLVDRSQDPVVYKKVVAPWELELALLEGREWSTTFESDFRALLPGGTSHIEVCESAVREEEASVSLITNKTQRLGLASDSLGAGVAGPVMIQEGKALAHLHVGGGGQVLEGRSWAGLDPNQTPLTARNVVVEGRKGIAAEYQDEWV